MAFTVFKNKKYRQIIKEKVEYEKIKSRTISLTAIATATRIPRAYLSQVVNEKKHLSGDQLYSVCQFLGLNRKEQHYLFLLRESETTNVAARKKKLLAQIKQYRAKESPYVEKGVAVVDHYFSDPSIIVVHSFLQIDVYSKDLSRLQSKLGLSERQLKVALDTLVAMECISTPRNNQCKVLKPPFQPQARTAMDSCYHIAGRQRVVAQKLAQTNIDDFMYNWWFASSAEHLASVKVDFLKLIRDIYEDSKKARQEKVYQLSLDIFRS